MEMKSYDVIVVGSGAGGATVACELAKRGKKVLILEAGPQIPSKHLGKFWKIAIHPGYYHNFGALSISIQGTTIYHTKNVGGTTVFACGNIVRSAQDEFKRFGIDLELCFQEAEKEIGAVVLDEKKIILGSRVIMETAQRLRYKMGPMPKGGNYREKCNACGDCVLGCAYGAKWDARSYIKQAADNGAVLKASVKVREVLFSGNQVRGVKTSNGEEHRSDLVILSAGGLNTPVILQKSGVTAGHGLFIDPFYTVLGLVKNGTQVKGASMSAVDTEFHGQGFILSPFIDHLSQMFYCGPMWTIARGFPLKKVLSIMVKITDERSGRVYRNGFISKALTEQDHARLNAGAKVAEEILLEAGANHITTMTRPRGAHPGGTAAIGEVVDSDLQVRGPKGLYACDASVFPQTPGLPPILTIVALAKWLGKRL